MSGFGLWQLRRRAKSAGWLAGAVALALNFAIACGSDTEPAPIPQPTSTPVVSLPSLDLGAGAGASPSTLVTNGPVSKAELAAVLSISDLVDRVKPTVASIAVESVRRGLFFDFSDEGAGTGIVVRPDGYIVTNTHVIQAANEIKVTLPSGISYDARVVGRDRVTDLSVLKIDGQDLPFATFGDSDDLRVGDWVVAAGNALALKGGPTVTLGIVSGKGRSIVTEIGELYDLIQTDAAINQGNSGGPLVNLEGEVVGINTVIVAEAQGLGFAISSSTAKPIIDSLIEHGRVVRPLIGVAGQDVTPAIASQLNLNVTDGAIITRISPEGPAYKAGLRAGDVIVGIDGIPTPDMANFLRLLWSYKVGDVVQLEYISNNRTGVTSVELAERPTES